MWSLGFFVTALISAGVRQARRADHLAPGRRRWWSSSIAGARRLSRDRERAGAAGQPRGRDAARSHSRPSALAAALRHRRGAAPGRRRGHRLVGDLHARHVRTSAPFIGGLSVTLFSLFMAIARLFIDPVVDRYSPARGRGDAAGRRGGRAAHGRRWRRIPIVALARLRADGRRLQRGLSARGVGGGAAHRPAAGGQRRGARADDVRRVLPRAAAAWVRGAGDGIRISYLVGAAARRRGAAGDPRPARAADRGAVGAGACYRPMADLPDLFPEPEDPSSISGRSSICGSRRRRSRCSAA